MSNLRVTLLGGTGFVGKQLTYRLAEQFDEVVVLTRRAQRNRSLLVLPNVTVMETNVHDTDALKSAFSGSGLVINLIGVLNELGNANTGSFSSAHDALTARVLAACKAESVPRYLHMSALNADAENGSSEYLRSKGRAEQHVRNADDSLAWTMFQPSVIFGEHDAFFNRFSGLLKALPVFPLAVPDARMAPVWVGDVCDVMMNAISDPSTIGKSIQLCGPNDYSLRELVNYTAKTADLKCSVIGLPDWAARLQARTMELVPGKPFSRDNYLSLQTDSLCSEDCARQKTSLEAVVPRYIGDADWTGRLQSRREAARR
ncbi:MAG: complex I NDUFA9 subunit family protein [Granulosicoccus sp.]